MSLFADVTVAPLVEEPAVRAPASTDPAFHAKWRHARARTEPVVAALLLLLLLPLMLVVVVAVRLTSPGPALFRQTRVGLAGKTFTIYKFRTMRVDAEAHLERVIDLNEHDGLLFKIKSDPRLTSIGRFLRRSSLDELPQLWNVIRGDMSLIGPRPALPRECAHYDAVVARRLAVKPGITGLWQVSGRSELSWAESLHLDLTYVDEWSPALDVHIALRTFSAVLTGRGAW